ncbi:MAG: hypothetical protein H6821_15165 [Planctomycetaceae bacterium]|nr:hypothetical protein [Planctomycetaceae bacterium]
MAGRMMSGKQQRELCPEQLAAIERLYRGELGALTCRGDTILDSPASVQVVLPGAFNPLHAGHTRMARLAARVLDVPVAFELSIENVEKPTLDLGAIAKRLEQFDEEATICVTRAATFAHKVQLFSRPTFAVGTDTIMRIADPRYYDNDTSHRDSTLESIAAAGASFLVFGRSIGNHFRTLAHLDLPASLRAICREVSEADFRHDISSTELRGSNAANE